MISHSQAKTIWRTIKNTEPSTVRDEMWKKVSSYTPDFPYRETIKNAHGFPVVLAMVQINLYFKHLVPDNTAGYENVGDLWLKLVSFIPPSRYSDTYKQLTEYFTQTKNYTPINVFTGAEI